MTENPLQDVARLAQQGDVARAYERAQQVTTQEPSNVQAWMWLAHLAQIDSEKRAALRQALSLQPTHSGVREALRRLMSPAHIRRAAHSGVFISYARADELFAVDLIEGLRASGINAWLDMTEININTTWHSSVARALTECGVMLLILSPEAIESGSLQTEQQWFIDTGKIIVPVLHKTCDYEALDLMGPTVDFRHDPQAGLRQLLQLLADAASSP
ncbi:MAG: toll/interleukin-1 receptor domain-containing protein [Anaerolineae bacterium]|nr:toll/interleukin-1 receptor domain-containing protein [Anaerolineae bacterium]